MAILKKEIQQALNALEAAPIPPLHTLTAAQARDAFAALRSAVEQPTAVHSIDNAVVRREQTDIPVRIYKPDSTANLPALVWNHGGGWVLGDLDTADLPCRDLCAYSGCAVISVDYRLAPESPFPAAFDDSLAVTRWTFEHARQLGIDANRIAVGGDSAGGNLAACVALQLSGSKFNPHAQVLIYPVTDNNFGNSSYVDNAEGFFLTNAMMQWFWDQYVPDESDRSDPRVNPLRADLHGLPPAIILTVENDPLRDEGLAFADALNNHDVTVHAIHSNDTIHGYFGMDLECSRQSRQEVSALLQSIMIQ